MVAAAPEQEAQAATGAASVNSASADGSPTALSEVTVTATKRKEPLQKVPIAITVVDGAQAQTDNLNNIRDISKEVPALNFRTAASPKDQSLFLRGMGTVSTSPGVEPTVSTVVDGVALSRQGQANMDLLDIDRIEVLRGPQGTLFGKNASAGVVNIITNNPSDAFHAFGDLSYYTGGDEKRLKLGVSGALVPGRVSGLVSVLSSQYDGNVENVYNGKNVNGYRRNGVRSKLLFTPNDDLSVTFAGDYMASHDTTPQGVVARTYLTAYPTNKVTSFPAFASALLPVVAGADNRQINSNYNTYADDDNGGVSAQVDWRLGEYELTSITAYRKWENTQFQDQDRLPAAVVGFPQQHDRGDLSFDQVSEELRIASPKGHFLDYVAGLYYQRGEDTETYRRTTTVQSSTTTTVTNGVADYGTTSANYSVFGEATLNFSDRFRGIAGARLIHDDLNYHFNRVSSSAVPVTGIQTNFTSSGDKSKGGYSDRLGLQYDLSATLNSYFTYSRGYKGPAYNIAFSMLPQDTGVLKPETSNAFEAGLKSKLLDNRVEANFALFKDDFKNYQVNFFDIYNGSPVTRLINAGSVSTKGVEADLKARPSEHLMLSAAAAYTKARIDQFNCPQGTSANCNVNGKPLPFAPDWKTSLRAEYRMPLNDNYELKFASDYRWQSAVQYSINQTPDTVQGAYGVWDASATLANAGGWRIALVGKNLTDKHYSSMLSTFSAGIVRFVPRDDSRYVGIAFHMDIDR
jgi:iron complex outermembrane receptor protein